MQRIFGVCGALLGFLSVALYAGRAHMVKDRVSVEMLRVFDSALRQHSYHALALLLVAGLASQWRGKATLASGWLFIAGVGLFSGSLYLMVLMQARWLGKLTPFGGLCFLAGWLCLAWAALGGAGDDTASE